MHDLDPFSICLMYCEDVKNDRTIQSAFDHAMSEMDELQLEIQYARDGLAPGADGIVGEAIDVIACMIDIIYQNDPDVSIEELNALMSKKCRKWKDKYSK